MHKDQLQPGLMVIHSNRPEMLRDLLSAWMQRYRLAPLTSETILVQSNGIAQWLKIALARDEVEGGCSISAGLEMLLPAKFLWRTFRAVLGADLVPEISALDKQPLTWRLMRLIPSIIDQPDFADFRCFLLDDPEFRKQLQLAQRLADLFEQYQVYRADWLEDWSQGRDQLRRWGTGHIALMKGERWQAKLWRIVLADIGASTSTDSCSNIHQRFVRRLSEASQRPFGLPERVIVFGVSSMPAQALQALLAISRHAQVLLCVHNPCRHYWADIVTEKNLLRKLYQHQPHFASTLSLFNKDNLHLQANPFLAALGRQGRDYISLLDHYDDLSQYHSYISEVINDHIDLFESLDPNSLLRQLQDDILEQRSLSDTRNHWAAIDVTTDTSIRMHSTHSKQRELEVLHDQLLARFDADPALCPTDIVVMMPDINAYAPYINAVFGLADHADVCRIPYVISGRKQRGHDPLYITLERLLNLPVSRWTVSEIMDLLDVASVRRCFGIAVTDLPLLHRWIKGSGIRWGLDGKQREQLGLPSANQANSWLFGLSRMLLGFAVGRGVAWDGIEPYDEIGGLDAAVIGQIWALVQRLADTADTMRQPATPDEWVKRLSKLVDDFFTMQDVHELEQRLNWLRQLDAWRDACLLGGLDQPLPLAVVREAWLSDIDTGSLNKHFLSGAVNFCTFISMRAVPFKVVCLLGMNDKDFPRRVNQNDFDLMQHDYRPGDRSLRDDDRYLFLEALLSAREQLYISWVGRNPCDNSKHLPSILVRQFLSHLDCGWQLKDNALSVSAALTCEHPLQSFSAQYFPLATKQGLNGWFTYSPAWYLRHESIILQTVGRDTPLAAVNFDQVISLTDVGNFLKQPVDVFFRDRLGIYFPSQQSVNADHESFALSKFETYGIYHSLYERLLPKIEAGLCGEDLRVAIWSDIARLQSAGRLPSAAFGELSAQALVQPAQYALDNYAALVDTWGESLPMPILFQHMDCDNNVTINDSFTGIRHAQGRRVCLRLDAGKLHHGTRFRWDRLVHYWVRHLALQQLGMPADSIIVSQTGVVILAAMPAYQAGDILQRIIALRADGLTKPLPVACRSAFGWLDALHDQSLRTGSKIPPHITKSNALAAAQITYEGKYNIDGEIVRSMALRRAYPHFYLMLQGGFEHYAQALYGSLHDWVNRSSAVEHRLAILNADISHE